MVLGVIVLVLLLLFAAVLVLVCLLQQRYRRAVAVLLVPVVLVGLPASIIFLFALGTPDRSADEPIPAGVLLLYVAFPFAIFSIPLSWAAFAALRSRDGLGS